MMMMKIVKELFRTLIGGNDDRHPLYACLF